MPHHVFGTYRRVTADAGSHRRGHTWDPRCTEASSTPPRGLSATSSRGRPADGRGDATQGGSADRSRQRQLGGGARGRVVSEFRGPQQWPEAEHHPEEGVLDAEGVTHHLWHGTRANERQYHDHHEAHHN